MINEITRESHPEIFDHFDGDGWYQSETISEEHIKHDRTCYTNLYAIDKKITDNEELWGNWRGFLTSSYACGSEPEDYPQDLYRIEKKVITVTKWVYHGTEEEVE